MKINQSSKNWIIDAILFTGFIVLFFLEFTGVALHQWLGIAGGALVLYHLLSHMDWVEAVTRRILGRMTWKVRLYYGVDLGLLIGFTAILFSGLIISTWLSLPMENGSAWIDFHLTTSIVTLLLVIIKMAIHWRWIVKSTRRIIPRMGILATGQLATQPVAVSSRTDRRDFLKVMGIVGAAGALALLNVARPTGETEAQTNLAQSQANAAGLIGEAAIQDSGEQAQSSSSDCTLRCRKGRSCSYPGQCHQYTDSNQNGRCDLGECA